MTEGVQTIRLSKVAKEFNVGLSTILDFLTKKGFQIDSNPNTKISEEIYNLLVKEYQTEKSVKEEAKKIGLNVAKKEKISIEDVKPETNNFDSSEPEKEVIIIKNIKTPIIEKIEAQEKVKVEEINTPKVIGKIDLDSFQKKPKSKKTEEIKPVENAINEDLKQIEKLQDEKDSQKSKQKFKSKKQEEELVEEIISTNTDQSEIIKEEINVVEKNEIDIQSDIKLESTIKVVGKMDLDALLPKKTTKKSKPEKPIKGKTKGKHEKIIENQSTLEINFDQTQDVEIVPVSNEEKTPIIENEVIDQTIIEEVKEIKEEKQETPDNFIKTVFQKLEGPTILGKMNLPEAKELIKKPVASSSEDLKNKKKKRKRIKKDVKPVNEERLPEDKPSKPKLKEKKPNPRFEPTKPEITEEEIEKQIKETLARLGGIGKSKTSKHRRQKRDLINQNKQAELEKLETDKKIIKATEFVSANELASLMGVSVNEIISTCLNLGIFVSINQRLDAETLTIVADEFGYEVEFVSAEVQESIKEEEDKEEDLTHRSPIVTVMGHVDHGKTSLLDYIRKTNVIAGEAGGITQHVGAYEVKLENGKSITFLDTPGHEAFTAMRARGAQVTDIVIIVVAADDNVMPQTIEAINHAQAAAVPIIIAINKVDKPNANPEKIREELSKLNILVEDWGGKYQCQEISAKKGINIDVLLEKVLLEAEMLNLRANQNKSAIGTVVESSLDKGRGYVAKLLVQNGTLKIGDVVLAGYTYGRVKAMYNERNLPIKSAGPSTPLLLLGLNGAPQAGDKFNVMSDEHEAKNVATRRFQLQREQGIRTQKHITLDEIGRRIAIGDFKELNIIIKGDVDGSIEALSDAMLKLSNEEVQVNVIHKSVGQVTESDVLLASASNAIIIGFQVRPSLSARKLAEAEQIDIRLYSIIYNAINEIKSAIEGMLAPDIEEKILCNIEVREVFKITKVGTVAGCKVLDGKVTRNTRVRLIRDGIVVYTGTLGSLKRFKDDVKEVNAGFECGLNIDNFNDLKIGDIIEGFEEVEVKRKL